MDDFKFAPMENEVSIWPNVVSAFADIPCQIFPDKDMHDLTATSINGSDMADSASDVFTSACGKLATFVFYS